MEGGQVHNSTLREALGELGLGRVRVGAGVMGAASYALAATASMRCPTRV